MPDDRRIRPFADWLAEQCGGDTHTELSEQFNNLIEAVQSHGKVGSITFTVKVKPAGRGEHGTVLVSDDIKVKVPTGERPEVVYFADNEHNLTRHNPAQPSLPLREVGKPDAAPTDGKTKAAGE